MIRLVSRITPSSPGANNEGRNVCGILNKRIPITMLIVAAERILTVAANAAPWGSFAPRRLPTRAEAEMANDTGNRKQNELIDWYMVIPPRAISGSGTSRPDKKIIVSAATHSETMMIPGSAKERYCK